MGCPLTPALGSPTELIEYYCILRQIQDDAFCFRECDAGGDGLGPGRPPLPDFLERFALILHLQG